MKRVRCPKCDNYIVFDDSRYQRGQQLVFECEHCHRQFRLRIGKPQQSEEQIAQREPVASIIVIENVFHYKQELPLYMGENVIGRYVKGNDISTPIETVDPSVDTKHCIIHAKRDKQGQLLLLLRDAPSETGTFVHNTILRTGQHYPLQDGDVVTIGATTFILSLAGSDEED